MSARRPRVVEGASRWSGKKRISPSHFVCPNRRRAISRSRMPEGNRRSISFRVSCQTAEATVLGADFDDDPKKSEFRVIEKLVASIDAATLSASTASAAPPVASPARGQRLIPAFFPERLYVLYQKEQPFDGLMLGPPYQGVVPRSAARQAAVERFLAVVTKSGLRESEVTRAIFEGRLSVERAALPGRVLQFSACRSTIRRPQPRLRTAPRSGWFAARQ